MHTIWLTCEYKAERKILRKITYPYCYSLYYFLFFSFLSFFNAGKTPTTGFPGGASGKDHAFQRRRCKRPGFNPWVGVIPGGGHNNLSSILAWRIQWTEEPGRWQSIGSHRVGHDCRNLAQYSTHAPDTALFTALPFNIVERSTIRHTEHCEANTTETRFTK